MKYRQGYNRYKELSERKKEILQIHCANLNKSFVLELESLSEKEFQNLKETDSFRFQDKFNLNFIIF